MGKTITHSVVEHLIQKPVVITHGKNTIHSGRLFAARYRPKKYHKGVLAFVKEYLSATNAFGIRTAVIQFRVRHQQSLRRHPQKGHTPTTRGAIKHGRVSMTLVSPSIEHAC